MKLMSSAKLFLISGLVVLAVTVGIEIWTEFFGTFKYPAAQYPEIFLRRLVWRVQTGIALSVVLVGCGSSLWWLARYKSKNTRKGGCKAMPKITIDGIEVRYGHYPSTYPPRQFCAG